LILKVCDLDRGLHLGHMAYNHVSLTDLYIPNFIQIENF